jgi:hypothetical protein
MTPGEEQAYLDGSKHAWLAVLEMCLSRIGYTATETAHANWISERADAVLTLRSICAEFGDNDWPDDLHLTDIIEKHLVPYLELENEDDQS